VVVVVRSDDFIDFLYAVSQSQKEK